MYRSAAVDDLKSELPPLLLIPPPPQLSVVSGAGALVAGASTCDVASIAPPPRSLGVVLLLRLRCCCWRVVAGLPSQLGNTAILIFEITFVDYLLPTSNIILLMIERFNSLLLKKPSAGMQARLTKTILFTFILLYVVINQ